jgi:SPOR domain
VRIAFFALLFLNLAYFAWAHWIDAPRAAPVNEAIARLPQLKLVDEVPPAERPQPHTARKTSLSTSAACVSLGPFADASSSSQAAALLRSRGFEPQPRAEQTAAESYWVYVVALSQAEADRALAALENDGIRDARVMPDSGGTGRRLSLGLYSERPRAERRAEAVRQAGLKPEIAERKVPATLYFLDLTAPAGGVDAIPLQELTARGISRVATQPCPAAAPAAAGAEPNDSAIAGHSAAAGEPPTARNPRM